MFYSAVVSLPTVVVQLAVMACLRNIPTQSSADVSWSLVISLNPCSRLSRLKPAVPPQSLPNIRISNAGRPRGLLYAFRLLISEDECKNPRNEPWENPTPGHISDFLFTFVPFLHFLQFCYWWALKFFNQCSLWRNLGVALDPSWNTSIRCETKFLWSVISEGPVSSSFFGSKRLILC